MNHQRDSDPGKPIPPNTGLDAILTEFLDKEIGIPSATTELSPDLDRKLSQTLKEIGLLPGSPPRGELSIRSDESVIEAIQTDENGTAGIKPQPVPPSVPLVHPKHNTLDNPPLDPVRELEKTIQAVVTSRKTVRTGLSRLHVIAAAVLIIVVGVSAYLLWREKPLTRNSGSVPASLPQLESLAQEDSLAEPTAPQASQGGPTGSGTDASELTAPVKEARQAQSNETAIESDSHLTRRQETVTADNQSSAGRDNQLIGESVLMNPTLRPPENAAGLPPDNKLPMAPLPDSAVAVQIKDIPLSHSTLPTVNAAVPPLPAVKPPPPEEPGVVTVDMAIRRVNPTFPEIAKRMKTTGSVQVEFWTDVQGKVVRAYATAGPPILRPAAQEALMKWRFKPLMTASGGIPGHGNVVFVFRSRD